MITLNLFEIKKWNLKYNIGDLFYHNSLSLQGVFAESADDSADNKVLSNYLADNRMDNVWNQLNSDMEVSLQKN